MIVKVFILSFFFAGVWQFYCYSTFTVLKKNQNVLLAEGQILLITDNCGNLIKVAGNSKSEICSWMCS